MDFIAEMQSYFRGEKLEALIFIIPAGLAFLLYAVVALKAEQGAYAWGIAIPCLLFALILTVTGQRSRRAHRAKLLESSRVTMRRPPRCSKKNCPACKPS